MSSSLPLVLGLILAGGSGLSSAVGTKLVISNISSIRVSCVIFPHYVQIQDYIQQSMV